MSFLLPIFESRDPAGVSDRRMRNGPDFIGIGSQKAGTGSTYEMLRRHRQCWLPPMKELHVFDEPTPLSARKRVARAVEKLEAMVEDAKRRKQALTVMRRVARALAEEKRDVRTYKRIFQPIGTGHVTGEITPSYALLPESKVHKIAAELPGTQIIYCIRDPISRLWSQARMHDERHKKPVTRDPDAFKAFCTREQVSNRSIQSRTIETWGRYFEGRFHVLFFDDLRDRPETYFGQLARAVGIEDDPGSTKFDLHQNRKARPPEPMPPEMRRHAESLLREEYERLATLIGGHAEAWLERLDAKVA